MSARLTLVVVGEPRGPAELPRQGRLVIGSGDRAHLQVLGQGVAEVHCAIGRVKGGGWAMQDLGSEFGTLVNGRRVESARLAHGDELLVGSRKLLVLDPAAPPAGATGDAPAAAAGKAPAAAASKAPAADAPARGAPDQAPAPRAAAEPSAAGRAPSERAAPPAAAEARPVPVRAAAEDAAPTLGGYRIQRLLGRGAMGAVYLATQTSLDRPVALKVMSPRLAADPRFVARFEAEARSAAALNHPNVVTVYDVGNEGDLHYLSMEYMDGGSLEARLAARGALPWREVLAVVRDAAAGLVYAESRRIVHRDIKPENLMLNDDGVTKIADLGLAVQVEAEEFSSEGRRIFGTPHFIAPELVRGEAPDSRSDLYSLGATAYRLLTGHTPFEGASTREILRGVLQDPAPPIGERAPGLPAEVAAMVHRLLEKDPGARHPSALILQNEAERLLRGEPAARPAAVAPKRRTWIALAAGAGVLVAALAARNLLGGEPPVEPEGTGPRDARAIADPANAGAASASNSREREGTGTAGAAPTDAGAGSGEAGSGAGAGGEPVLGEKEFELKARVALLELRDLVLTDVERAKALRELAVTYAGTDVATEATAAAAALDAAIAAAEEAERALAKRRERVLAALRVAASPEVPGGTRRAGEALRNMAKVAEVAELNADPTFRAQRDALVAEVLAKSTEDVRALLQRADEAAAARDFEALAKHLREAQPFADLPSADEIAVLVAAPEAAAPRAPEGYGALNGLVETARERLSNIGERRAEIEAEARAQSRAAARAALGSGIGFEQDLRRLDLEAAANRLRGAASARAADASALEAAALELTRAAETLAALRSSWASPGWKRRAFPDPRVASGRSSVEAIGVEASGVVVDAGGRPETIPWSAWSNQPRALDNLLTSRLERDYTAEERVGAAVLVRLAATLSAIDEAQEVLVPGSAAKFSEGEASALVRGYDSARPWAEAAGPEQVQRVADEIAAAELFSVALRALSDGRWSGAVASFERLLATHGATFLVLALSDGGGA